jgi:hypothetical protein
MIRQTPFSFKDPLLFVRSFKVTLPSNVDKKSIFAFVVVTINLIS